MPDLRAGVPALDETMLAMDVVDTIRHADRIVVVTENGIEEEGSHSELLKRGGHYARLHDVQTVFV